MVNNWNCRGLFNVTVKFLNAFNLTFSSSFLMKLSTRPTCLSCDTTNRCSLHFGIPSTITFSDKVFRVAPHVRSSNISLYGVWSSCKSDFSSVYSDCIFRQKKIKEFRTSMAQSVSRNFSRVMSSFGLAQTTSNWIPL